MDADKPADQRRAYAGAVGSTRRAPTHVACPECGWVYSAQVYRSLNVATDPKLGETVLAGGLNVAECPLCSEPCTVAVPLIYHDPHLPLFTVLVPASMRHAELDVRIDVLEQLAEEPADIPPYVRDLTVSYGTSALKKRIEMLSEPEEDKREALQRREKSIEAREHALERREEELLVREEDVSSKQEDLLGRESALEERERVLRAARAEIEREREALRGLALDLAAQRKRRKKPPPLPADVTTPAKPSPAELKLEDRPQDEVDRWRAGDAPTGCFLHEGKVYLTARVARRSVYRHRPPTLLAQLRRIDGSWLVGLIGLPDLSPASDGEGEGADDEARRDESKPAASPVKDTAARAATSGEIVSRDEQQQGAAGAVDDAPSLLWPINPGAHRGRAVLGELGERFVVHLDLFDEESRPLSTWTIEAPLAENVRLIVERVGQVEIAPEMFEATSARWRALDVEERLGRKQHNFSEDSFADLPSPAAVRLALGILNYWSERENEDYLLLVKSFPLEQWHQIRRRVVERAIDFGLYLGDPLTVFALKHKIAETQAELLRISVANFAEVSLRLKPSDLDARDEWENWKSLLAECVQHGVEVESQIEELAASAARRAQQGAALLFDEREPGGDFGTLDNDELIGMLADRDRRRDAALELCERGDPTLARAIFSAVRNMTRGEVVRVVPALAQLGAPVVPLFVEGLSHRKSFIRQGCALGLGALKAVDALVPMIDLLTGEPTRIWREVARGIGDVGTPALASLAEAVSRADGEARERLAWAMAHVVLAAATREGESAERMLTALVKSDDAQVARVARRAEMVSAQVRQSNAEVRGSATPGRDQTIVRAFTRRFYESMEGEVNELSEEDIVDAEEVLADEDILEEQPADNGASDDADDGDEDEGDGDEADDEAFDGDEVRVSDEDIIGTST
ncbi:MAG: hypothetical protein KC503_18830 [Myxococcales bacterium]|nr:hypothetical protein [Myxococcales bacterium]